MPLNLLQYLQQNALFYLIASKVIINTWIIYLNTRQLAFMSDMISARNSVVDTYAAPVLRTAIAYQFEKILLSIIHKMYDSFVFVAGIFSGATPFVWRLADSIGVTDESKASYFVGLSSILETVVYLPLSFIDIFVIEQRYGFNRQDIGVFFAEVIGEILTKFIVAVPVVWGIIRIMRWKPETYQFHLMGFILLCRVVLILLYLEIVLPTLATFKPLPDGHLKDCVQVLADEVQFPLYDIYVMEASQSTTHGNAFFIGLGTRKMIVFYDTMLEGYLEEKDGRRRDKKYSESELLGILAHEMGHWSQNHITKALVVFQIITCLEIWLCSEMVGSENMNQAVGFNNSNQPPGYIEFLVIAPMFLAPVELFSTYVANWMSRRFEYEADTFSVTLGQKSGLISGLKKVSSQSLKLPASDQWYSAWYDSHPTLVSRLSNINNANQ